MALIGFARVTSRQQDLEAQLEALNGADCSDIITSQKTGKTDNNAEQIEALITQAQKGDTVILTKLYRLGHSAHKVLVTLKALHDKGVAVKTLDGQIDTFSDDPTQKAMAQLLVIFADLERSSAADKSASNQEKKPKKGRKNKPLDQAHYAAVKKLSAEGTSISQLSKQFYVSRSEIEKVLDT
ncbi:recombinase family protein [Dasania marina]|uniref:recombinase family protein n=1 Tax=Dasania marina TaxID=471499 RepID=UPI00035C7909|nr:recombinase family protein [Dasania marina]